MLIAVRIFTVRSSTFTRDSELVIAMPSSSLKTAACSRAAAAAARS